MHVAGLWSCNSDGERGLTWYIPIHKFICYLYWSGRIEGWIFPQSEIALSVKFNRNSCDTIPVRIFRFCCRSGVQHVMRELAKPCSLSQHPPILMFNMRAPLYDKHDKLFHIVQVAPFCLCTLLRSTAASLFISKVSRSMWGMPGDITSEGAAITTHFNFSC